MAPTQIYAYRYEHTDDFLDLHPLEKQQLEKQEPTEVLDPEPLFSTEFVKAALAEFKKLGWEGDTRGDRGIQYFVVPDFMVSGRDNSYGVHPILYLKQDHKGTEFFASTKPLPGLE
jgi:hypothetical protein